MEKREQYVEIIEVTVNKVTHKVGIRVLELHRRGFEYREHPLEGCLVKQYSHIMAELTSGATQKCFLESGMERRLIPLHLSLTS